LVVASMVVVGKVTVEAVLELAEASDVDVIVEVPSVIVPAVGRLPVADVFSVVEPLLSVDVPFEA